MKIPPTIEGQIRLTYHMQIIAAGLFVFAAVMLAVCVYWDFVILSAINGALMGAEAIIFVKQQQIRSFLRVVQEIRRSLPEAHFH